MRPILLSLVCVFFVSSCASSKVADEPTMPAVVEQYFDVLDTIFRAGSTPDDVAALMDLTNDDVQYIHHNYQADFDKESWRAAFMRNMDAGGYKAEASYCTVVTNTIPGEGYFAAAYAYGTNSGAQCVPNNDNRLLIVFKIVDGKLSKVEEMW